MKGRKWENLQTQVVAQWLAKKPWVWERALAADSVTENQAASDRSSATRLLGRELLDQALLSIECMSPTALCRGLYENAILEVNWNEIADALLSEARGQGTGSRS